mgnify:CR=1 FL=1
MNLDYQAVIDDLESRKAALEDGIAAIRRIAQWSGYIQPVKPAERNITADVLGFLSDRRAESFYSCDVAHAISASSDRVRGAVSRYVRKGVLLKDSDGRVRFVGAAEENRDV